MLSYTIPDSIEIKLYKQKTSSYIVKISNKRTWTWFTVNDVEVNIKDRIFFGSKTTVKCLKRGIETLELGFKRSLTLYGVGYKGWVSDDKDYLLIKVSNAKPSAFKLPDDIAIAIDRNTITCWSYNINIIDHFFKTILFKTPAPKNSIKWRK